MCTSSSRVEYAKVISHSDTVHCLYWLSPHLHWFFFSNFLDFGYLSFLIFLCRTGFYIRRLSRFSRLRPLTLLAPLTTRACLSTLPGLPGLRGLPGRSALIGVPLSSPPAKRCAKRSAQSANRAAEGRAAAQTAKASAETSAQSPQSSERPLRRLLWPSQGCLHILTTLLFTYFRKASKF